MKIIEQRFLCKRSKRQPDCLGWLNIHIQCIGGWAVSRCVESFDDGRVRIPRGQARHYNRSRRLRRGDGGVRGAAVERIFVIGGAWG